MSSHSWLWIGFNAFVVAMLAIDLGLFHRKEHAVSPKEAGIWTGVWITLSLVFCGLLWAFSLMIWRWMAKHDPQLMRTYIRSVRYRDYYPAFSRPYRTY